VLLAAPPIEKGLASQTPTIIMDEAMHKASILMEALPYIKKFFNKTIVIKYGGHAMVDEALKNSFTRDVVLLKYIGMNPVIVHGGGPQIGKVLEQMGIESKFHRGIRITDEATIDVVEMVLVGKINKEIVGMINQQGGKAVGLSGADGELVKAKKLPAEKITHDKKTETIDLGRVGSVSEVNANLLKLLDKDDFIPVIAPVGISDEGESLNINADLVAGAVASALQAEKLVLLTDVEGVKDSEGKLISKLTIAETKKLIKQGVIKGGMIPKVECCIRALEEGVKNTHIIDGRQQHAILLEIFTDLGVGTVLN